MKRRKKNRNTFAVLGTVLVLAAGCSKKEESVEEIESQPSPESSDPTLEFPVTRPLVDAKGRSIEAELIARSETHVRFFRLDQAERVPFDYPIQSLSVEDQAFLAKMPTTPLAPLPERNANMPSRESIRQQRIDNLEEEIQRQKKKAEEMQERLQKERLTSSQRKALQRDLVRERDALQRLIDQKEELKGDEE